MKTPISEISLTREQVREIDRRAIEEYGIPGVVLMENAGRNAAKIIETIFNSQKIDNPLSTNPNLALPLSKGGDKNVAIICGGGNNGGDGFVIARHLANEDIPVDVFLTCDPTKLSGDAATNYRVVEKMKLPLHSLQQITDIAVTRPILQRASLIVDALLGTGFTGQVRSPLDQIIEEINALQNTTVVAVDLPSGLDCDTGQPANACIRANATITFVARKKGFDMPSAAAYTGKVYVADIGAPREIIDDILSKPLL